MSNPYYNHSAWPATSSSGSSALARAEMDAVAAGFALLPILAANGGKHVIVNSGANALTVSSILSETGSVLTIAGTVTSTGAVTASGFVGPLTGNVTGNVSGSSGSTTGNAASANLAAAATALATPRAINGVNFDGTAPITIADASKLPLTGGTLSGALTGTGATFSGNVGIGAAPLLRLQVHTAADINIGIGSGVVTATAVRLVSYNDAGSTNIPMEFSALTSFTWDFAGVEQLRLNATGLKDGAGNTFQPVMRAAKPATTSRASNAVLSNDPDLQFTLGVGTWRVKGFVPLWATTGGAGGLSIKPNFTGTATTAWWTMVAIFQGTGPLSYTVAPFSTPLGVVTVSTNSANPDWVEIVGTIVVTVAGTFSIQWSQNTSNGNALNFSAGAYVECLKVA